MEGKTLARVGAIAFVAVAITATMVEVSRKEEAAPAQPSGPASVSAPDPLRAALVRCQRLGQAAEQDAGCLVTWAENRRRFLGLAPVAMPPAAAPLPAGER